MVRSLAMKTTPTIGITGGRIIVLTDFFTGPQFCRPHFWRLGPGPLPWHYNTYIRQRPHSIDQILAVFVWGGGSSKYIGISILCLRRLVYYTLSWPARSGETFHTRGQNIHRTTWFSL